MKKLMMIVAMVAVIAMAGVANAENLAQDPTATVYHAGYDAGGGSETKGTYPVFNDGDVATGDYWAVDPNNAAIVMWSSPVANVNQIVFHGSVWSNGGWWGTSGSLTDIIAPTVQYTTDAGTTWVPATGVTDDYVATVDPLVPFTGTEGLLYGPATFDFDALGAVDGVRLYGSSGGNVGGEGWVRIHEIEVYAQASGGVIPEPAGLGLIGLALLAARRRRS